MGFLKKSLDDFVCLVFLVIYFCISYGFVGQIFYKYKVMFFSNGSKKKELYKGK